MSDVTDADIRGRVDQLLTEHADDDETTFLGAQFDAGLARMDYPVGLGGLDASPKLQEIVDEALEGVGRRYPWIRNPMGIGMCFGEQCTHALADFLFAHFSVRHGGCL